MSSESSNSEAQKEQKPLHFDTFLAFYNMRANKDKTGCIIFVAFGVGKQLNFSYNPTFVLAGPIHNTVEPPSLGHPRDRTNCPN